MPGESQMVPESAPDPTARTTEQLLREIENLKEYLDFRVSTVNDRLTEVIASRDHRVDLAWDSLKASLVEKDLRDEQRHSAQKITIDSVDQRLTEVIKTRDERVQLALTALERANTLAAHAFEKRIDELNQFRAQNKDQEARFAIADVVTEQFKALEQKLLAAEKVNAASETRLTRIEENKRGGNERLTAIYALAAFVVTLIVIGTVLAANGIFSGGAN